MRDPPSFAFGAMSGRVSCFVFRDFGWMAHGGGFIFLSAFMRVHARFGAFIRFAAAIRRG